MTRALVGFAQKILTIANNEVLLNPVQDGVSPGSKEKVKDPGKYRVAKIPVQKWHGPGINGPL